MNQCVGRPGGVRTPGEKSKILWSYYASQKDLKKFTFVQHVALEMIFKRIGLDFPKKFLKSFKLHLKFLKVFERPDAVRTPTKNSTRAFFEKMQITFVLYKIWWWNIFYRNLHVICGLQQKRFDKIWCYRFSTPHFRKVVWLNSKEL